MPTQGYLDSRRKTPWLFFPTGIYTKCCERRPYIWLGFLGRIYLSMPYKYISSIGIAKWRQDAKEAAAVS